MTSDPYQKGNQADQRQHQGEGDGGVGRDGVEEQVDYSGHGDSTVVAGLKLQNVSVRWSEEMNNRKGRK